MTTLHTKAQIVPSFCKAWRVGQRAIFNAILLQDAATAALLVQEGEVSQEELTALLTHFAALQPLLEAMMADEILMRLLNPQPHQTFVTNDTAPTDSQ